MNYKPLKIGNLIAKLPIIQGGMGVGVSLSNLAGNVAKHGAIGIISAAHPGYKEYDFESNTLNANIRALKNHIKNAKSISNNGIIGVNLMVAMNHYKDFVESTIEAGADLIISGAGLPLKLPEYAQGSSIKLLPIVSSLKATKLILNYWKKHYDRIPDGFVVEGPKAGGHLGFKADNLQDEIINFDSSVKEIIDFINIYEKENECLIPIIVAGGVYDNDDFLKYLSFGASGIQVGSRFVATEECDAHSDYKNAYVNCSKDDIKIVVSPVGMPGRAINNSFLKNIHNNHDKITKCYNCLVPCNPSTTPYCISKALIDAVSGDIDNGLIFCGENAHKINTISTVKDVLSDITKSTL